MLELRNPHTILAALARRPKAVKAVQIAAKRPPAVWEDVAETAAAHGIPVTAGREQHGARRGRRQTERTGAGSATVEPPSAVPLNSLFPGDLNADHADGSPPLWLGIDQIQDPQNLGAVFRLAGFFGVRGIVMTRDRTAPLSAAACDVSAGGTEHVPFCQVPNLAQAIKEIRHMGVWVMGTCERATQTVMEMDERPWMLIIGNEGDGLRRLTRDRCDVLVSVPPLGPVPSLNVAAATSACLALLTRPR